LTKRARKFEDAFWSGEPLDKLYQRIKKSPHDPLLKTFSAGMEEWQNTVSGGLPDKEELQASLRQRVERAMTVTISREMQRLERGMTFLATVGSTAPFIGLFGTVWGIMNSFTAIAQTNNTSLAVVAPGIAEALFATALGLVAAIPAVVAYNGYSNRLGRYAARLDGFVTDFVAILSRHLENQDRSKGGRKAA
jgi:biopolymer transport protein TolQ